MSQRVPPCEHCGQHIDTSVYYHQDETSLRAWHTDRPDCWAAALRDGSSR
ncbi:hypothetical protein ACGFXC_09100 [Streptomyces sp. NPDC048507]